MQDLRPLLEGGLIRAGLGGGESENRSGDEGSNGNDELGDLDHI